MAAFDTLPEAVRFALHEAVICWDSVHILSRIKHGVSVETIIASIKTADKKEIETGYQRLEAAGLLKELGL